jgi:hypothetical protein
MKPYHELKCALLPDIQSEVFNWLNKRYDLTDQKSLKTDLWLKIDSKSLLKSTTSLMSWFRELKLICRETAITVINDMSGAALHIDELPTISKINIPIINYQHVSNEWYHVPDNLMSNIVPSVNQFGSEFYDLGSIDISQCELIENIELQTPIVFNSQIPHRVVCKHGAKFPRVILTCMFYNEPIDYLRLQTP